MEKFLVIVVEDRGGKRDPGYLPRCNFPIMCSRVIVFLSTIVRLIDCLGSASMLEITKPLETKDLKFVDPVKPAS